MHASDIEASNREALNQVAQLNQLVSSLDKRLSHVEHRLFHSHSSSKGERSSLDSSPAHVEDLPKKFESLAARDEEISPNHIEQTLAVIVSETTQFEELTDPVKTDCIDPQTDYEQENTSSEEKDAQSNKESLEARIGLYWLNRLGIASLVIGMALFLMYSFQSFGAVAKIITGFITAFSIIGTGEWIERTGGPKWYARGLAGGGWSLVYFTTYAMHYVPSVEIVHSFILDWLLLAAVSACTMWYAIMKNSEIVALLSVVLGFITVALTDAGFHSALATAVLVISFSAIAVKERWYQLFFWGVIASYGSFLAGLWPDITSHLLTDSGKALLTGAHVGVYWGIYNLALLQLSEDTDNHRTMLIVASLINAWGFFTVMNHVLTPLQQGTEYYFPIAVAFGYALSCPFSKKARNRALYNVHLLLSLTFATSAIPMLIKTDWYITFWIAEVALLVWLGLKYHIPAMRWFAVALAAVASMVSAVDFLKLSFDASVSSTQVIVEFSIAFASYALAAVAYNAKQFLPAQGEIERTASFNLYFLVAGIFAWWLPVVCFSPELNKVLDLSQVVASNLIAVCWLAEAAAGLAYGLDINSRFVRTGSYLLFALIPFSVLSSDDLHWCVTALISIVLFAEAVACRYNTSKLEQNERNIVFHGGVSLAAVVTIFQTGAHCAPDLLPLAFALEGACLVVAGYLLKTGYLRGLGMIFCFVTGMCMASDYSWSIVPTMLTALVLYAIGNVYRKARKEEQLGDENSLPHLYELGGTAIITCLIGQQMPVAWLSPAWSLEAFALLFAGFAVGDKSLRISGLTVLGLVAWRLLFIELAGAETIQRIISFIVAGIILLASSYGYSGFMRRFLSGSGADA